VSRDDDSIFSSFVNCIVLATVYAAEKGITKDDNADMPTMTLFGKFYLWSLKDAISANGNYDEIYNANFVETNETERGRNALNLNEFQHPQLFSIQGLES